MLTHVQVMGTLKGYDQLMNLVLDDVQETLRGISPRKRTLLVLIRSTDDEGNESSRNLGLIVARGTLLVLISPVDGSEEIENPFQGASED